MCSKRALVLDMDGLLATKIYPTIKRISRALIFKRFQIFSRLLSHGTNSLKYSIRNLLDIYMALQLLLFYSYNFLKHIPPDSS
jgi:hypothetical protein